MHRFLLAACLLFTVQSFGNTKADEAAAAYSLREYNEAGLKNVQEAVNLYVEAIQIETDDLKKRQLMLDLATAYYFQGQALEKKDDRKQAHQNAMDVADKIMTAMGVDASTAHELTQAQINDLLNKFDEDNETVLADAFYTKGINLGQWGRLNGVASSIGRLPVVLGLMDRIEMMGYESIHEYGSYRTIGRTNFVLPKIFGGDLAKSEKYLKDAYRQTLVEGQRYSLNPYNNIYLAETMYKAGKETQAKNLLDTFLAADITTLKQGQDPENREAMRVAQELADDWK